MSEVRVLIVGGSLSVRAVLRRVLNRDVDLALVGEATTAEQAKQMAMRLEPDAIVLDLDMPGDEGYAAVDAIMSQRPTPIVALTSRVERRDLRAAFRTTLHGVVAFHSKPALPEQWEELGRVLPETLRHVGSTGMASTDRDHSPPSYTATPGLRLVAIGASTGGPGALRRLLGALGRDFSLGIVVVQHIAPGFDSGLADWLAHDLQIDVRLARDGERLRPGTVRLAGTGRHLRLERGDVFCLDEQSPPRAGHRPSVDELFLSLKHVRPREMAAVLLSGMGRDGVEGMLALRRQGTLTVVQNEATCAVFGMPRVALESAASELAMSPEAIAQLLLENTCREGT